MQPDPRMYLWHAREALALISEFTEGVDKQGYLADAMLRSAVERQFEIVGEALNQLNRRDPMTVDRIEDLPRIVAFRNVLVHAYASIDNDLVWEIVTGRLPALIRVVEDWLGEEPTPG